jgi:hypothetical protein
MHQHLILKNNVVQFGVQYTHFFLLIIVSKINHLLYKCFLKFHFIAILRVLLSSKILANKNSRYTNKSKRVQAGKKLQAIWSARPLDQKRSNTLFQPKSTLHNKAQNSETHIPNLAPLKIGSTIFSSQLRGPCACVADLLLEL